MTFPRRDLYEFYKPIEGSLSDFSEVMDLLFFNKLLDAESKAEPTFEGFFVTDLGIEFLRYPARFSILDGEVSRHESIKVDAVSWTGLTAVRINAKNAKVIGSLIETALENLNQSDQGNEAIMQASAYLKAAQQLVEAPNPPSVVIWDLIQKAAAVAGLLQLFSVMFQQALLNAQTH